MRILEAATLLFLLPAVLGLFFSAHRRPRWAEYAPFAALLFGLLHLLVEGWRWQLAPVYVVVPLLCSLSLRGVRPTAAAAPPPSRPWYRHVPRVLGALVLLIAATGSAFLAHQLPVFELLKPTGEHRIGTRLLSLRDDSRPEHFTEAPDDKRELLVEAWYPAEVADAAKPVPFWGADPRRREMLSRALTQPGFFFDHLARVPTHSYADAPLAGSDAFPVLIFSHGYAQGFTAQNTMLMEELASHGYAVFSIGHPHESSAVIFPDGRMVELNQAHMQKVRDGRQGGTPDLFDKIKASSGAERLKWIKQLVSEGGLLTDSVHLWVADTRFVLDQMEKLIAPGSGSPFAGRLDLSRVGVLGMSFGGTTAGQAMLDEPRLTAGVNLDGTQYGELLERPLPKPFLFMNNPVLREINAAMYEHSAAPAWYLVVNGTQHFDFTDFPMVAPLYRLLGVLGKIPGEHAVRLTNAYTLAFFDRFLKNQPAPLLDGPSAEYPEVEIQSRNTNGPPATAGAGN